MNVLTGQQRDAVDDISQWYASDEQIYRLFGFAGTGKTTLAKMIVEELGIPDGRVAYAAFTGKAASVLRSKGCVNASTIHKLIYLPREKAREHLRALKEQLEATEDKAERAKLQREIAKEEKNLATPDWTLNLDSELNNAALLILDEVSMVDYRIASDLMAFGVKMLVLGDPAQLPPVSGEGFFMKQEADCLLTEIHRSALDSPVTRLSMVVRQAPAAGKRTLGVEGMDGDSGRTHGVSRDELMSFDQVLVGTNRTRWSTIRTIRGIQGRPEGQPVKGDRIMTLVNNTNVGVFNGQQFEVQTCQPDAKLKDRLNLTVVDDDGKEMRFRVWSSGFHSHEGEKQAALKARNGDVAATFAAAITTHKAQGSQWANVLVADEASVFYGQVYHHNKLTLGPAEAHRIAQEAAAKPWLYTAITRASERVVIVPPSGLPGVV